MSSKLQNLPNQASSVAATDLFYMVQDPGGTPLDTKITAATLANYLKTLNTYDIAASTNTSNASSSNIALSDISVDNGKKCLVKLNVTGIGSDTLAVTEIYIKEFSILLSKNSAGTYSFVLLEEVELYPKPYDSWSIGFALVSNAPVIQVTGSNGGAQVTWTITGQYSVPITENSISLPSLPVLYDISRIGVQANDSAIVSIANSGTLGGSATANSSNRAIYKTNAQNSLPAAEFDGANHFYNITTSEVLSHSNAAIGFELHMVVKPDVPATDDQFFYMREATSGNVRIRVNFLTTSAKPNMQITTSGGTVTITAANNFPGSPNWAVVSYFADLNNSSLPKALIKLLVNGNHDKTDNTSLNKGAFAALDVDLFRIGVWDSSGSGQKYDGRLGAVAFKAYASGSDMIANYRGFLQTAAKLKSEWGIS